MHEFQLRGDPDQIRSQILGPESALIDPDQAFNAAFFLCGVYIFAVR